MYPDKNYVLGRGELYFAPFDPGTRVASRGQEYFGNTTEINLTSETEMLDHFDSDHGIRVKDDSVQLELNRTGTFITDNVNPQNLSKWLSGSYNKVTVASATSQTQTFTGVRKGVRYQIGATGVNPTGLRGLATLSAVKVATPTNVPLVVGTDIAFDAETGGFTLLRGGVVITDAESDAEDQDVIVTYDVTAHTFWQVKSGSQGQLEGQLFYKSFNPKGAQLDYLFPYVQLAPDGDMALKGDDWQNIPFRFEALKLNDTTESVYTNGRPGVYV